MAEPDEGQAEDTEDQQPAADAAPNAADPKAVREQRRKAKRATDEGGDFWRRVFADPIGRREMWLLLQSLHTFEERFACGPNGFPQPEATWFHAGEQAFGLRLYQSWMLIDRPGVFQMHDECDPRLQKPKRTGE